MLKALARAEVTNNAIAILVTVGAHRASTSAKKIEKLGHEIVSRYRKIDLDGTDDANLIADLRVGSLARVLAVPDALHTLPVVNHSTKVA